MCGVAFSRMCRRSDTSGGAPRSHVGTDTEATDRALEERIARERAEAVREARQSDKVKRLEKQVAELRKSRSATTIVERAAAPVPATPADGSTGDWPGGSAYTTILVSAGTRAEAERVQRRASDAGLDAGVLYSSDYKSLRAGYWVVFSGASASKSDADARTARAKSLGFSDAYPRFVAP